MTADKLKEWVPVIHSLLTLILFVAVMFGGDSTRIAEAVKKAEAVLDAVVQVKADVTGLKAVGEQNAVVLKAIPKQ